MTFILLIVAAFIVTAFARMLGTSFWASVAIPTLPLLVFFLYFAIGHDKELGPHGGIIPVWVVAGVGLVVGGVVSLATAWLIPGSDGD